MVRFIPKALLRRRVSPLSRPSVLRYEVQIGGLMLPGQEGRSIPILVGTLEQCTKYAQDVRSELQDGSLQVRVRPSTGFPIFLDPEVSYPRELQSLAALLEEFRATQKEAQR